MRVRQIFTLWLPLAVSFELMMLEGPAVQGAMGRLPDPKLNLAAWGLVISLSLLIESPVIMLLATAIALVQDADSYRALRRFMLRLAIGCTLLTALVAFTPLFDFVAIHLMGQPAPIVYVARPGMQIMLLWTAAIAWRRFYQGVLVRSGQTRRVSWGTAIRLTAAISTASLLAGWGGLGGVQVGAVAIMTAVITEALATTAFALPVVRRELLVKEIFKQKGKREKEIGEEGASALVGVEARTSLRELRGAEAYPARTTALLEDGAVLQEDYAAPQSDDFVTEIPPPTLPLSQRAIWQFHAPLAATTLLTLLAQPLTAAALARLPAPVATLAVWPVVSIVLLVMRGWGLALQEITVSQAKNPDARPALARFALLVGIITSLVTVVLAFSPLLDLYLGRVLHLPADLWGYAHVGVGVGVFLPLITALGSHTGGLLVAGGQTQYRYRGMAINLATHVGLLVVGVILRWPGMPLAASAFTCAACAEYIYLAYHARRI